MYNGTNNALAEKNPPTPKRQSGIGKKPPTTRRQHQPTTQSKNRLKKKLKKARPRLATTAPCRLCFRGLCFCLEMQGWTVIIVARPSPAAVSIGFANLVDPGLVARFLLRIHPSSRILQIALHLDRVLLEFSSSFSLKIEQAPSKSGKTALKCPYGRCKVKAGLDLLCRRHWWSRVWEKTQAGAFILQQKWAGI